MVPATHSFLPSGLIEMPWWRESLTNVVRSSLVAGFFGSVFVRVILSEARSYSKKPLKNDTWK